MTNDNKELKNEYNYLKTKKEMLDHYAKKEPMLFEQYDGFKNAGDDVIHPDYDGDSLTVGDTCELMSGYPEVRVLIPPKTKAEDAVRLLLKIAIQIKSREIEIDKMYEKGSGCYS